jgi:hypothetical protein
VQQTTWNEIPEKTNSSSSLTKNTLCTFIKVLRAPNPKPGVHWSLNNQVGTYIQARKMQHCSSVFHILPNLRSEEEEEATWNQIRKKFLQNKISQNSIFAPQILLSFLTDSHGRLLKSGPSATLTSQKLLVDFHYCRETVERTGTCAIPSPAAAATGACCSWH